MARPLHAQAQKADGAATQAQGCVPPPPRTISDCDRSTTSWSSGSKRISSSPSWPIVCTSRCAPDSARSPQGSPREPCSTSLPPSKMLDVHFPTTDGRTLILNRYTEPNADQRVLLDRLSLTLPPQPPPRITAAGLIAGPSLRM